MDEREEGKICFAASFQCPKSKMYWEDTLFVEASNLMAGDVLGSCGIFVYVCACNSYSVLKGFLKHGKRLLLNL